MKQDNGTTVPNELYSQCVKQLLPSHYHVLRPLEKSLKRPPLLTILQLIFFKTNRGILMLYFALARRTIIESTKQPCIAR